MQRIFVTGASGFIGAAVSRALIGRGYKVAAMVRPDAHPWRLAGLQSSITFVTGDLHDRSSYEDGLAAFAPDAVIHLGWKGVRRDSCNDPDQVRVNVTGSVDLFHAAQRAGCGAFVGAGSQAEYDHSHGPVTENSPTRPASLYGAAKLATHDLLSHLAKVHGMRFAWLRVFSIYGPQDDPSTLISYLIKELLHRRRPRVSWGDHLWDYLYIEDAADAFVTAALVRAQGVFNVASGCAVPLRETITMIRDLIDPDLPIGFGEAQSAAARPLYCSVDHLRGLGWEPRTPLLEGLQHTINWHRDHA